MAQGASAGLNDTKLVVDMISRLESKSRDVADTTVQQSIAVGVLEAAVSISNSLQKTTPLTSSSGAADGVAVVVVDQVLPLASALIRNSIQNHAPSENPTILQTRDLNGGGDSVQAIGQRLGRNQQQMSLDSHAITGGLKSVELWADGNKDNLAEALVVAIVANPSIFTSPSLAQNLTSPIVSMSVFDGESKESLHRGMQMRMELPSVNMKSTQDMKFGRD